MLQLISKQLVDGKKNVFERHYMQFYCKIL